MPVYRCKMCGATLSVAEDSTTCTCDFCDSTQTIPLLSDEKKINLFNRANRLRAKCEFDAAEAVYQNLVSEFSEESEAYWGLCLCKFGIEYVEDPLSGKMIPTCHRTMYESIFEDVDYLSAIKYSDSQSQLLYQTEARHIDEIQKKILQVAKNETPYDVFICYKESDENKERTADSVLAQEIYDELTKKGIKVFFSRITLEDKLGVDYEPYIFSALQSARVMLIITSSIEYVNSVWVKNEWSRYARLALNDHGKTIIPCYQDIDPEDLPAIIRNKQAQNMSKIGAMQDLIRGVCKVLNIDTVKTVSVRKNDYHENSTSSLLKRAYIFLEDSNWKDADKYFERVLDASPECAEAYLGKLLVELKITKEQSLTLVSGDFSQLYNYKKAYRFADDKLKKQLQEYKNKSVYNRAASIMKSASTADGFMNAKAIFDSLDDYSDARAQSLTCHDKALETTYRNAMNVYNNSTSVKDYEKAAEIFEKVGTYSDAVEMISKCDVKAHDLKYDEAYKLYKRYEDLTTDKNITFEYCQAAQTDLKKAIELFNRIIDYSDSERISNSCAEKLKIAEYAYASSSLKKAETAVEYKEAGELFEKLGDYLDAPSMRKKCRDSEFEYNYNKAYKLYKRYEDLTTDKNITFEYCQAAQTDLKKAIELFDRIIDYSDSERISNSCAEKLKIAEYAYASSSLKKAETAVEYKEAGKLFEKLGDYLDAPSMRKKCRDGEFEYNYNKACDILSKQTTNLKNSTGSNADIRKGINVSKLVFEKLENYKDSKSKLIECEHALMDIEYYKLKNFSMCENNSRKDWESLIKALGELKYGEYRKDDINNIRELGKKRIKKIDALERRNKRKESVRNSLPAIGTILLIAFFILGEVYVVNSINAYNTGKVIKFIFFLYFKVAIFMGLPLALVNLNSDDGNGFKELSDLAFGLAIIKDSIFIIISFAITGLLEFSLSSILGSIIPFLIVGVACIIGEIIGSWGGLIISNIIVSILKVDK